MSDQRHHTPGPYSRGVGWTWVALRNCNWKSRVIVRLGAWEFGVMCHPILPTEAVLEIQCSSSFISRPLWGKKKIMAFCTSALVPGREGSECQVSTHLILVDVIITRRLRDRELLRKRKAEALEKDSAHWVLR